MITIIKLTFKFKTVKICNIKIFNKNENEFYAKIEYPDCEIIFL